MILEKETEETRATSTITAIGASTGTIIKLGTKETPPNVLPLKVELSRPQASGPLFSNQAVVVRLGLTRESIGISKGAPMTTSLRLTFDSANSQSIVSCTLPSLTFSMRQIAHMKHEAESHFGAGFEVFAEEIAKSPNVHMTEDTANQLYGHLLGLVKDIDLSKASPAAQGQGRG